MGAKHASQLSQASTHYLSLFSVIQYGAYGLFASIFGYLVFLGILTIPIIQSQVIYLNRVTLTWFQDVNFPEQWGFLHNQVTPFHLKTPDGETLHAWQILPLETYRENEARLLEEPAGLAADVTERLSFRLLRDDPGSLLVLYFHGAAGTLGSGFRPPSYRAISAAAPNKIHIVAIDYRGYGTSTGKPSEEGMLTDAVTLTKWAMEVAGIPPERIVIFAQSLGTAVALSLMHHLINLPEPVLFSGTVLVAPFVDVEMLTASYRVAGTIPLLDPIAKVPGALSFFNRFIWTKWPSKTKIASFVRSCEDMQTAGSKYHITMIHAQDDYDIPWFHTDRLFWHAVNASLPLGISYEDLERVKQGERIPLGAGGWQVCRRTKAGVLREEIAKHGLHDRIMSYPIVSQAILRAFKRE